MNLEIIFLFAAITILSVILFIVTLLSYRQYKNKKLLIVSFIFFFLFVRGVFLSFSLFNSQLATIIASGYVWSFDLIVLILLTSIAMPLVSLRTTKAVDWFNRLLITSSHIVTKLIWYRFNRRIIKCFSS